MRGTAPCARSRIAKCETRLTPCTACASRRAPGLGPAATPSGTPSANRAGNLFPESCVVPSHTLQFGQQKLRTALKHASHCEAQLGYGFILHARRRGRRSVLGVITPSGESLALTPRLLSGLARRPLWLFGTARVALESGETIRLPRDGDVGNTPLTTVLMHVEGLHQYAPGAQRVVEVEATVIANALIQPLVVLTTDRPVSWPL